MWQNRGRNNKRKRSSCSLLQPLSVGVEAAPALTPHGASGALSALNCLLSVQEDLAPHLCKKKQIPGAKNCECSPLSFSGKAMQCTLFYRGKFQMVSYIFMGLFLGHCFVVCLKIVKQLSNLFYCSR